MQKKIKESLNSMCLSAKALYAVFFLGLVSMRVRMVRADIFSKVEQEGITLYGNLQRIAIVVGGVCGLAAIILFIGTGNQQKADQRKSWAIKCVVGVFVCVGFTFFIQWAKNLASGAPDIGSLL